MHSLPDTRVMLSYFFFLVHLVWAAFRAFSRRSSSVSFSAEAFPPLRPSATAAGFFLFAIRRVLEQRRAPRQIAHECYLIGQKVPEGKRMTTLDLCPALSIMFSLGA
jgi:hypothetical protein